MNRGKREKYGGKVEYRKLDITDEEAVGAMFEAINEECEVPISGVFAAAGIQQMVRAVEYKARDFRRIMDVNVTGTFWLYCLRRGAAGGVERTG